MTLTLINPTSKSWTTGHYREKPYILWFGAYGTTRLLVYARHLSDALDECIDWIGDNAPGLLCNEQVNETYNEAMAEGLSEEEAFERASEDTTVGGNCGDHILSWEWGIVAEDPTPAEIAAIHHDRPVRKMSAA